MGAPGSSNNTVDTCLARFQALLRYIWLFLIKPSDSSYADYCASLYVSYCPLLRKYRRDRGAVWVMEDAIGVNLRGWSNPACVELAPMPMVNNAIVPNPSILVWFYKRPSPPFSGI
jgi:hypothetical protein